MTAVEFALILLCLLAFAAFVVMLFTARELLAAARDLERTSLTLEEETIALVRQLRSTVATAGAEVERVDAILDVAETISARVDSASRLGYVAFSAPVIRFLAFWRGLGRGIARLVGGGRRRPAAVVPRSAPPSSGRTSAPLASSTSTPRRRRAA